jgi:arsenate reductase
MAETFLNALAGDAFLAESAGLEPGSLNPNVVEAMKEIGFDISKNKTKSVFEYFKEGKLFNYVITVCDDTNAERCPTLPGYAKRLHWPFDDPSKLQGNHGEKLQATRIIRDRIKARIEEWISEQRLMTMKRTD